MDTIQDEEAVIGFDALYNSAWKCKKGVGWKDSVAAYSLRRAERTANLCRELHDGTYKAAPPKHFRITHPKPRNIASIAFRDRVYQRSLNDNVVYPVMTHSFILDNYACQQGKGTDGARDRLKDFLLEHYRRHGMDGFVAQFDIHGYYPNMRHDVAEAAFGRKLEPWAFERVKRILREQYSGVRGYDPGSQLVQIAGISVLDPLDHFIKEQLHAHLYIRYMDDFMIISPDMEYLERCQAEIKKRLESMGFELNPAKTRIYNLRDGIMFLGFRFTLTATGKVLLQLDPHNVKAERKKLVRLVHKSQRGGLAREKVDESYRAWRNHAEKGNSYHLLRRMDKFYTDLWKGGTEDAADQQNQNDAK